MLAKDWKNFIAKIDTPHTERGRPLILSNTPEYLLRFVSDLLSYKSGKQVKCRVYNSIEDIGVLKGKELPISVGSELDPDRLATLGYMKVERVWEQGEYSVLGDVVTVWQEGGSAPIRISLWGKSVESIEIINPDTRLSIREVKSVSIGSGSDSEKGILHSYTSNVGSNLDETVDLLFIREQIAFEEVISSYSIYEPGLKSIPGLDSYADKKQLERLLKTYRAQEYRIFVMASDPAEIDVGGSKVVTPNPLFPQRGFVDTKNKRIFLTDVELFGEIELEGEGKIGQDIFKKIVPGDYVVHDDHGIGIFDSVVEQEGGLYLQVNYANKDRLLIPLSQSKKIHKFVGAAKAQPSLTGLGGLSWKKIQKKAKADAQRVAKELIQIYAMRKVVKTDKVLRSDDDVDGVLQFAQSFKHEDTEDQQVITNQIISDLSNRVPMDRLVVGDVGFGKTELAVRAAYAAVLGGKQVALLAPTTVLVEQHLGIFRERLADSGVNASSISRLRTRGERKKILEEVEAGKVDVLIGTHAILSDEVRFKDLGLLIVDEEQKFGVSQKEKIKQKRVDLNVLSMTATPIPRTLNMALKGVKDMSILASVPEGRKPILNHFERFDWDLVAVAVKREIERGGQAYFVHNRVYDIEGMMQKFKENVPGVSVDIIHGQMSSALISSVMRRFVKGEIDVLMSTTIIENGLDMPNVNTLIVNGAQNFGLSQLYQIRGRVGRSSRQAYAYFLYGDVKGDAVNRLNALKESKDLGSGFIISNRDLEIRGIGDILGSAQSGAINSVGYAMYSQILEQTIAEIKGDNSSE